MNAHSGPGAVLMATNGRGLGLAHRVDTFEEAAAIAAGIIAVSDPTHVADWEWQIDPRSTVRDASPAHADRLAQGADP